MISNILEQEDVVKGMPDAALQQEAQVPSGMLQQFLVISEIKRRTDMRKRHQNQMQEQPQGTVAEQIVMEGITGIAPQQGVGMPPQMGPQQMPPQGGPQMPPQMPPQGMPPQMPPQTPPQQPPPGMPPMAMAAGGIVRMQGGGQAFLGDSVDRLKEILASNPNISFAELVGMGFTQDDLDRLRTMGYRERLASEGVLSDAIAGLERIDPPMRLSKTMPLPEVKPASEIYGQSGVTDFAEDVSRAMQTPIATAGDRATLERIRSKLSPSISSSDIDAGIAGMVSERAPRSKPPPSGTRPPKAVTGGIDLGALGDIDSSVGSGIQDMYGMIPRSSPDGGIVGRGLDRAGELGSEVAGGISSIGPKLVNLDRQVTAGIMDAVPNFSMFSNPFGRSDAVKNAPIPMVQTDEEIARNQAYIDSIEAQMDAIDNAQVQGKTGADVQPSAGVGAGVAPTDVTVQDPKGQPDALTRTISEVIETQSEGESPARASYNSAIASIDQLISDLKNKETQESPALDLSDIIDRSKRMTEANVLMQLGSGILAGDTAKGIQRASEAGLAGTQQVANLEMKERIAKTQAGREDIRRGEQRDLDIAKLGIQKGQLEMMDTRLANELNKAERVSKGQLFNLVSDLVGDATDDMMAEDRLATVDKLSAYFMQKYAPLLGISLTESDLALLGTTFSGAGGGASGGTRAPLSDFAGG